MLDAVLSHGAHYLGLADWGCGDRVHSTWLTVEAESKAEAIEMLPPASRPGATAVTLSKYSSEDVRDLAVRIKEGTARPDEL